MMEWPDGFGRITLDTIDSTNKEASRLASDITQPTWILAEEQTSGVGRRGRKWSSQKGNFSYPLLSLGPHALSDWTGGIPFIFLSKIT